MRKILLTTAAVVLMATAGVASAKGCISGAAVGGVAGHVAGGHGLIGATAGCAINHHRNKVKDQKAAATDQSQRAQTVAPPVPATAQPK